MKRCVVLLILLLMNSMVGYSQWVVEAPTLETLGTNQNLIMGTMSATMASIEEAEDKVERLKKVAGWIESLSSMQEFIQLLETTACLARDLDSDLSLALDLVGERNSCLQVFRYKVAMNKLRYVVDVINIVLTDGFSMSRGDRLDAYRNALQAFEAAQLGLGKLSLSLRRIIMRYDRAQTYKKGLQDLNAF